MPSGKKTLAEPALTHRDLCWHMASVGHNTLTHLPLVPHICSSISGQHWFQYWTVTFLAPSHYLNQCWAIVYWTLRSKLQSISIKIQNVLITKMHLNTLPAKCQPFCPRGDVLKESWLEVDTLRPRHDGHLFCRSHVPMHFLERKLLNFK